MKHVLLLLLLLWIMTFSASAMAIDEIGTNAQTRATKPEIAKAAESKRTEPTQKTTAARANKSVLIESRVTGSQEQPKVLYIMPWQGITNPISVDNNDMKFALPQFKPIHPKVFQQQIRDFSAPIGTVEQ
ncbi:hypothetical protein ACRWQN_08750 [Shewanella sp. HL-SH8]|uniref:hypothetical protein n=1 Tax=Shewanella sp. HL-SH8 TaxID=3436242 RepID=UPI003EBB93C8